MEERNDGDYKVDDVMLPGFRFHPTDEELVGFYLRRKIQQRSLPIELIKQVDIYKYDPWDLPKLASTGEKEWYFYCPRDRKYRNSARPNRVTGAGFWKATGTDRPIYSSEGSKCIGLKKSLVFYRGRAAKGIKTDWMMHEFRLPSLADPNPPKKLLDKSYPANDAWAICRIFKKTNSMAQRALSQSWISSLPEATPSDQIHIPQFTSKNNFCNNVLQHNSTVSINIPSYEYQNPKPYPISNLDIPFVFSPLEMSGTGTTTNPYSSMFSNQQALIGDISKTCHDSIGFEGSQEQFSGFSISLPLEMQQQEDGLRKNSSATTPEVMRSTGFPFSLAPDLPDAWAHNLIWDSDSPQCPSDLSSSYSTNKCYS